MTITKPRYTFGEAVGVAGVHGLIARTSCIHPARAPSVGQREDAVPCPSGRGASQKKVSDTFWRLRFETSDTLFHESFSDLRHGLLDVFASAASGVRVRVG